MSHRSKTAFILSVLFLFSVFLPIQVQAKVPVRLWIEGGYVVSDVNPIIENNRTLVPIRIISETLGFEVFWNPTDRKILIQGVDQDGSKASYLFQIDKTSYINNELNQSFTMDVAPKIENNRTYVPIRLIAELFDKKVDWDLAHRTVIIGEGYVPPEENIYKYPINEQLANVKENAARISGVDMETVYATVDMAAYSDAEIEILNSILKDLLKYLGQNNLLYNPDKYYADFDLERQTAVQNYIIENELDGTMVILESRGYYINYTYGEIKKLAKSYLGIDTYYKELD